MDYVVSTFIVVYYKYLNIVVIILWMVHYSLHDKPIYIFPFLLFCSPPTFVTGRSS